MNARKKLDKFLDWRDANNRSIKTASVYVRTETLRRLLGIRRAPTIVYRDTVIKCLGSPPWAREHPGEKA